MRVDLHYYGGVPMNDAGNRGPVPTDRRYGNDAVIAGYRNLEHWARTADRLGYDTFWLTEHHFQYEGYEVTPNLIQFGQHLASITDRLRQGQMFNVVPQWHPLRLAWARRSPRSPASTRSGHRERPVGGSPGDRHRGGAGHRRRDRAHVRGAGGDGRGARPARLSRRRPRGRRHRPRRRPARVNATGAVLGEAIDALGGVDVLVNNAGVLRKAPLLDIGTDDWDDMFAVTTRPVLVATQVVAQAMIAAGTGGTIVNMASMAAKTGGDGQAHYAAAKAAVVALTRVAAIELGPHRIRVNCLCPGYVLTDMGAATRTSEQIAAWTARSPLGRLGEPTDVARAALFLASDDAGYLTGQALNVTGGMVMA